MTGENQYGNVDIDEFEPTWAEAREANSEASEIAALRAELDDLRAKLAPRLDPAEEAQIMENRQAAAKAAEREAAANAAAEDPNTLDDLKRINTDDELDKFLRERGMGSQLI